MMGQIPSSENMHQNVETFQDEIVRQARVLSDIATLTYKDFQVYLEEVNALSRSCMDAEGKQLVFEIKKGTSEGLLWKNNIRILCYKHVPEAKTKGPMKIMTINQFLRVYRSLKLLFKVAEESAKEKDGFDGVGKLTASSLIKDIDLAVGAASECCICFERPHEVLLPCCHSFCQMCIQHWNVNHKTCPICRESVESDKDSWVLCDVPSGFEIEEGIVSSLMDVMESDSLHHKK